ncbi:hypothetical protein C7S18_06465 [Ahniella affigens]|uniref:Calx-beta domain-containing protein n=1 Tax=Ahniella affigens TaxID=2021234 RepID=A0A2P1PPU7_9GAMM|nr:Calx-beta domain-containing protein [Ahniella affigens]AVP96865.1 hypothetical protein C7S18_06465 [Ahniella affigens]
MGRWIGRLGLLCGLWVTQEVWAANFLVNSTGSQSDADASAPGGDDNVCDVDLATGGQQCTLRAAIQEANDQTGPHNITFQNSITLITLTNGLDNLTAPVTINGTTNNAASGNRVEINANNTGCFNLAETSTAANSKGARGSTIQNLVIRNCSGNGITLSGHGYTITGNRIGTNAAGAASDLNNDANDGHGISLSGTAAQPNSFPNVSALINDPPNNLGEIAAFVTALQAALTVIANPTFISSNLISGNKGDGIDLFTPSTVNVQVNANIVGLNQAGLLALPNGRGSGNGAGIRMSGGAYGNVIGPGNIVSGQNEDSSDDGIVISGDVLVPNFVFGNLVGLGSAPGTDVGNGDVGMFLDTKPDRNGVGADNPTGFSLFVGPANTVSDNRSDNGGGSLDAVNGDVSGGIVITGTAAGVRVYANIIGLGTFPAGGTPLGALEYGNKGNGIVVTTSNNQIGGSEVFEANLILANERHGILIRGGDVSNVRVQGNFIGASDPTGLGIFGFGNRGDGVYIVDASSVKVGGTGEFEDNVIAANGRHGIKVFDNGSESDSGWSNLFQRNQIYANDQNAADGIAGLGIDLDQTPNGVDAVDDTPDVDPNQAYGNFAQNAPILCTGAGTPDPLCTAGPSYNVGSGATAAQWTIKTRPNGSYRIESFQLADDGMTFLNEQTISTDASGRPTGAGCVAGLCSASISPATATDTRGSNLVMTATDLFLADVPPLNDAPPVPNSASNNTSEFSNIALVPNPGQLRFSLASYTVAEGVGNATITVQRVGGADGPVGVSYASSNGSANAGSDYSAVTSTLSWMDQDSADQTFAISIVDDGLDEDDETVNLTLSSPTGGATLAAPSTAVLTITDNDPIPSLSIADVTVAEGNVGTSNFQFTITLSAASSKPVSVTAASSVGSATAGVDYQVLPATVVNFAAGETSKPVNVLVNGDSAEEPDETFLLNLSAATNASILDPQALGTIANDDAGFSISDASAMESNVGTSSLSFTITRTTGSGAASVMVTSSDGTATLADNDYQALAATTVNFADGQTSAPVALTINGDTRFEADETVNVTISNPVGGSIVDATGIGTIQNDDSQPMVSISDVSQVEGNAGNTAFAFAVTLSNPSAQTVSVSAQTNDSSANAGSDYASLPLTVLTFVPGDVSETVLVQVSGDVTNEPNETFSVDLTGPNNASVLDAQGIGTIQNDDAAGAEFNIDDVSVQEGNAGTQLLTFTVSRTQSTGAASVQVQSADGTATLADADYLALALTTLSFADGDASETVSVTINGDLQFEADEVLSVILTNPVNAAINDGTGVGTIGNDDAAPSISISDVSLVEGNAGTTAFQFTVSLSNPSSQPVTVMAASANGSATAGSDYTILPATMVSFVPGDVSEIIAVDVSGDVTDEPTETFFVNLTAASNATIADAQGQGTIQNDDGASALFSIADASVVEGNAGTVQLSFVVTRSNATGAASVTGSTADGSATAAGNDYLPVAAQVLNFVDGDATETLLVTVNGDVTFESDELLGVTLSNPVNGAIGDGNAVGTISNDDAQPSLSISDVSQPEGAAGSAAFTFDVILSNPSSQVISVTVQSVAGSATAGTDYQALPATMLSFAPGDVQETASVLVNGDLVDEADETFQVTLSAPSNASILDAQGLGTILNDDAAGGNFSISDASVVEGNAGTTLLTFTVSRDQTVGVASVQVSSLDGTATVVDNDYVSLPVTTLAFADGDGVATVQVTVNGDDRFELNETMSLVLANPVNAGIADASGIGTLQNDDPLPGISISDLTQAEGNSGTSTFAFVVALTNPSSQVISVNVASTPISASSGADFAAVPMTTINFAPGTLSQTVNVSVFGDLLNEADETFTLDLSNPVNATINDTQGVGTIQDEDAVGQGAGAIRIPSLDAAGRWVLLILIGLLGMSVLAGARPRA